MLPPLCSHRYIMIEWWKGRQSLQIYALAMAMTHNQFVCLFVYRVSLWNVSKAVEVGINSIIFSSGWGNKCPLSKTVNKIGVSDFITFSLLRNYFDVRYNCDHSSRSSRSSWSSQSLRFGRRSYLGINLITYVNKTISTWMIGNSIEKVWIGNFRDFILSSKSLSL